LQCVAVCCSVLQCVAVPCSVLQCVAVCCSVLQCVAVSRSVLQWVAVCRTSHSVMSHLRINQISHARRLSQSSHTYEWVMSYMTLSHVKNNVESCHTSKRVTSHTYEWLIWSFWIRTHIVSSSMWTIVTDSDFFLDWVMMLSYGVASISRLLKMIGLFFRI